MRRCLLLVPLAVLGLAGPASAHTELVGSSPAAGGSGGSVDRVVLSFSDVVQPALSTVVVTGPDGGPHAAGPVAAGQGNDVVQALDGPLPDGAYTVAYRVVADDGHPVTGELAFTVTGAAPAPAPPPAPATSQADAEPDEPDGSLPVLPLAVGGVVAAGAVGLLARRRPARR